MGKKQMNFRLSENAQNYLQMALEHGLGNDKTEIIEYALITYMWEEKPEIMTAYVEEKKAKMAKGFNKNENY